MPPQRSCNNVTPQAATFDDDNDDDKIVFQSKADHPQTGHTRGYEAESVHVVLCIMYYRFFGE